MSITLLPIILASFVCVVCASFEQTNEGSEFYVAFFQNRFGLRDNAEKIPAVLWITTKETTKVKFTVSTINETIFSGFAMPQRITYVEISLRMIVSDSTLSEWFKGIHIKTKKGKKIVVFGQNEEEGSSDAYLALPVIKLLDGRSYEYIVASFKGDSGTAEQAKDSVALIIGTENNTKIVIKPSVTILNHFAPFQRFIPVAPDSLNTITIQRFQTVYLQVRGEDISGTRITANKPISVFSGHECADVPLSSEPCDMLIEQIPPIDTWGSEVVTIPLKTKEGDIIKVIASQDATRVNVIHTNIDNGTITKHDTFSLNAGQFKELLIKDFSLIQSDNPIAVFQFARSFRADYVLTSDPLMLLVPPYEQYCNSYAVATAPFEPSLVQTVEGRVAYVNYTNIAVPAEFFNISSLMINNKTPNASEFKPIRRADKSIWGYGAQLLLDEGAQTIKHQNPNAVLSVTIYGFSNQQSWGCTGGMGLAPVAVPRIITSNMVVFENDGTAVVKITRHGLLNSNVSVNITTADGTATAGIDYTAVSQMVRFKSGQSLASINIPIKDDDIYEEPNITIRIIIVPNKDVIVLSSDSVVTIVDDDHSVQVKFSQPLYSTLESNGILYGSLVLSEPLQKIYRIKLKLTSRNATRNEDFHGGSINVKFSRGTTVALFTIPIIQDRIFEGTEIFTIKLSPAKQRNVKIGKPSKAIGQIIDEATIIKFNQSTYTIDEDKGSVEPVLLLSIPAFTNFTVRVLSISKSASGGGIDYNSGPYTVIIPADVDKVSFSILITNDNKKEENETFHLVIDSSSLPDGVVVDTASQAVITIVDVTPTTIKFNQSTYSIDEDNGSIKPVLLLNNPSSADFTVKVLSISKSAIGGIDYNSGPYTVIIPANVDEVSFSILIINDNKREKNETFHLVIDSSSLPDGVVVDTPSQAVITIVDVTKLSFNQSVYSVNENAGAVWPVVVLSDLSLTDVIVRVLTISGSASGGGIDYIAGPYTVTIPAGKSNVSFRILITKDNIKEINETFNLVIDSSSLSDGVAVGSPGQALVIIVDKTSTVPNKLPCDSFLRTLRPELFTHCECFYTTWSSWTRTNDPLKFNNLCKSKYSFNEIRSREVYSGVQSSSCMNEKRSRSVCEPTIRQKAKLLVVSLGMGRPASPPFQTNRNTTNSRRSITDICDSPSKQVCESDSKRKRSMVVETTVLQNEYKFLHDNSIPVPFDLEEKLSIIKKTHRHRRQSTTKKRYILFILDTSGSIDNQDFAEVIDVLHEFIPLFCGDEIKFAVMTFDDIMKEEICFNCKQDNANKDKVKLAVKSIMHRNGPSTHTGAAAECACEYMLTAACGFSAPRGNPPSIDVLFFTDGKSNAGPDVCDAVKCLKDFGNIHVFSFGIGNNVNQTEIDCIVKDFDGDNSAFRVPSFESFKQLKNLTVAEANNGTCFNRP